jgi:preprotein translocase subunit YajC
MFDKITLLVADAAAATAAAADTAGAAAASDPTAVGTPGGGLLSMVIMLVPMILIMYFLIIRPQKKKEKAAKELRDNIQIGDEVTTIGGITGIVTKLAEDTVVIETGGDRSKIRIKKWAVSENATIHDTTSETLADK